LPVRPRYPTLMSRLQTHAKVLSPVVTAKATRKGPRWPSRWSQPPPTAAAPQSTTALPVRADECGYTSSAHCSSPPNSSFMSYPYLIPRTTNATASPATDLSRFRAKSLTAIAAPHHLLLGCAAGHGGHRCQPDLTQPCARGVSRRSGPPVRERGRKGRVEVKEI